MNWECRAFEHVVKGHIVALFNFSHRRHQSTVSNWSTILSSETNALSLSVLWLPVDSKFPQEDYQRLVDAADRADADGVAEAGKAFESRLRKQAKDIRDKYIAPPYTTDFAILFLPSEGLYAEASRPCGVAQTTCLPLMQVLVLNRNWQAIRRNPGEPAHRKASKRPDRRSASYFHEGVRTLRKRLPLSIPTMSLDRLSGLISPRNVCVG